MANEKIRKMGGNARNSRVTHPRRMARQTGAEVRQEERERRSPAQQLAELDARLGVGVGARKERARLTAVAK